MVLGASVVLAGAYALKQLVAPVATKWYKQFYGIQDDIERNNEQLVEENRTAEIVAAAIEAQVSNHSPFKRECKGQLFQVL